MTVTKKYCDFCTKEQQILGRVVYHPLGYVHYGMSGFNPDVTFKDICEACASKWGLNAIPNNHV